MEAPADEPGREHVVLARQEMEQEVSRVLQNARGARDSQIILVPNEIGSLHRTSSRASRVKCRRGTETDSSKYMHREICILGISDPSFCSLDMSSPIPRYPL